MSTEPCFKLRQLLPDTLGKTVAQVGEMLRDVGKLRLPRIGIDTQKLAEVPGADGESLHVEIIRFGEQPDGCFPGADLAIDALAPIRVAAALAENVAASDRKLMVFISSMMGSITQTNSGDAMIYRSSKACLNAAVNVLGNGLRPRGIACVLFHPGWVRTDMGGPAAAIDTKTSVRGMFNVIDRLKLEDNGRFINYDGFDIPR